jgi:hypothetical protein
MPDRFRVVATFDSIGSQSFGIPAPGKTIITGDRWFNTEYGRNAYTKGMRNHASHASLWPLLRDRVLPGGWIVFQDNALGVSDAGYAMLLDRIIKEAPKTARLLGVIPSYLTKAENWKTGNDINAADSDRRGKMLAQAFMTHPSRAFVYLGKYMHEHPEQFPDGQHPDLTARRWIKSQIMRWIMT